MKVHLQVIVESHRFSTGEIIGGDERRKSPQNRFDWLGDAGGVPTALAMEIRVFYYANAE